MKRFCKLEMKYIDREGILRGSSNYHLWITGKLYDLVQFNNIYLQGHRRNMKPFFKIISCIR